ncbi:hypothetical protein SAMN06297387_13611 [Streptomyces zhaozhouensis]|uniref:Uncharacterized protein n=1 Tax=Streptomyces zhaozhouensis TaxID=1300267 RepID=A0A286EA92_9ACTN|nr:hypothetical protein [Streptomyces zhaozhouensis]SOD67831.1 hypothetical protein SAMN06297387_13611 [Streptomyces zhaozhouensis]
MGRPFSAGPQELVTTRPAGPVSLLPLRVKAVRHVRVLLATRRLRRGVAVDDTELPAEHPALSALQHTYLSLPGEPIR